MKALRSNITKGYTTLFNSYVERNQLSIFKVPKHVQINHHAFWVIFDSQENAELFMAGLREKTIYAYIGYMPLHSAPIRLEYGYDKNDLPLTEDLGNRIVRLPFYTELGENRPRLLY